MSEVVDEQKPDDHEAPPTQVQPFTRTMIKQYLDRANLTYLRDEHGDFRVDFAYDDDLDCATSFWLMATGAQEEIYGIEARSTRRFSSDRWDWCLLMVNEWNARMRYPKAYFHAPDTANGKTGEIRLEQYTDLEKGVHQELLDSLTYTVMGGAMRFWSWLNDQPVQQPLTAPIEDRLDG